MSLSARINTSCLTCLTLCRTQVRGIKKIARIEDPFANKKAPVADYESKSIKVRTLAFSWGLASSGALATRKFLEPETRGEAPRVIQHSPYKIQSFKEMRCEISDVAAGHGFSLFAVKSNKSEYSLYGSGVNTYNQIGWQQFRRKRLTVLIEPVPIPLPINSKKQSVQLVAAGRCHSLALVNPGHEVYSFGCNSYGQLGRAIVEKEDYTKSSYVHRIPFTQEIVDIVCGQDHSLFLTQAGQVYACGLGADGQTGLGHYENVCEPQQLAGDLQYEKIIRVSACADSNLAVNDKGDVFGWGNSEYLQFNSVTDAEQLNIPRRLPLDPSLGKIVDVAAGGSACLVLNDQGEVFVWGYGYLGKGPEVDHLKKPSKIPKPLFHWSELDPELKVVRVFAGLRHFAATTNRGDLFMWGKNRCGCLGLGLEVQEREDRPSEPPADQFYPLKVRLALDVLKVSLGVDHMLAMCKTNK